MFSLLFFIWCNTQEYCFIVALRKFKCINSCYQERYSKNIGIRRDNTEWCSQAFADFFYVTALSLWALLINFVCIILNVLRIDLNFCCLIIQYPSWLLHLSVDKAQMYRTVSLWWMLANGLCGEGGTGCWFGKKEKTQNGFKGIGIGNALLWDLPILLLTIQISGAKWMSDQKVFSGFWSIILFYNLIFIFLVLSILLAVLVCLTSAC